MISVRYMAKGEAVVKLGGKGEGLGQAGYESGG